MSSPTLSPKTPSIVTIYQDMSWASFLFITLVLYNIARCIKDTEYRHKICALLDGISLFLLNIVLALFASAATLLMDILGYLLNSTHDFGTVTKHLIHHNLANQHTSRNEILDSIRSRKPLDLKMSSSGHNRDLSGSTAYSNEGGESSNHTNGRNISAEHVPITSVDISTTNIQTEDNGNIEVSQSTNIVEPAKKEVADVAANDVHTSRRNEKSQSEVASFKSSVYKKKDRKDEKKESSRCGINATKEVEEVFFHKDYSFDAPESFVTNLLGFGQAGGLPAGFLYQHIDRAPVFRNKGADAANVAGIPTPKTASVTSEKNVAGNVSKPENITAPAPTDDVEGEEYGATVALEEMENVEETKPVANTAAFAEGDSETIEGGQVEDGQVNTSPTVATKTRDDEHKDNQEDIEAAQEASVENLATEGDGETPNGPYCAEEDQTVDMVVSASATVAATEGARAVGVVEERIPAEIVASAASSEENTGSELTGRENEKAQIVEEVTSSSGITGDQNAELATDVSTSSATRVDDIWAINAEQEALSASNDDDVAKFASNVEDTRSTTSEIDTLKSFAGEETAVSQEADVLALQPSTSTQPRWIWLDKPDRPPTGGSNRLPDDLRIAHANRFGLNFQEIQQKEREAALQFEKWEDAQLVKAELATEAAQKAAGVTPPNYSATVFDLIKSEHAQDVHTETGAEDGQNDMAPEITANELVAADLVDESLGEDNDIQGDDETASEPDSVIIITDSAVTPAPQAQTPSTAIDSAQQSTMHDLASKTEVAESKVTAIEHAKVSNDGGSHESSPPLPVKNDFPSPVRSGASSRSSPNFEPNVSIDANLDFVEAAQACAPAANPFIELNAGFQRPEPKTIPSDSKGSQTFGDWCVERLERSFGTLKHDLSGDDSTRAQKVANISQPLATEQPTPQIAPAVPVMAADVEMKTPEVPRPLEDWVRERLDASLDVKDENVGFGGSKAVVEEPVVAQPVQAPAPPTEAALTAPVQAVVADKAQKSKDLKAPDLQPQKTKSKRQLKKEKARITRSQAADTFHKACSKSSGQPKTTDITTDAENPLDVAQQTSRTSAASTPPKVTTSPKSTSKSQLLEEGLRELPRKNFDDIGYRGLNAKTKVTSADHKKDGKNACKGTGKKSKYTSLDLTAPTVKDDKSGTISPKPVCKVPAAIPNAWTPQNPLKLDATSAAKKDDVKTAFAPSTRVELTTRSPKIDSDEEYPSLVSASASSTLPRKPRPELKAHGPGDMHLRSVLLSSACYMEDFFSPMTEMEDPTAESPLPTTAKLEDLTQTEVEQTSKDSGSRTSAMKHAVLTPGVQTTSVPVDRHTDAITTPAPLPSSSTLPSQAQTAGKTVSKKTLRRQKAKQEAKEAQAQEEAKERAENELLEKAMAANRLRRQEDAPANVQNDCSMEEAARKEAFHKAFKKEQAKMKMAKESSRRGGWKEMRR